MYELARLCAVRTQTLFLSALVADGSEYWNNPGRQGLSSYFIISLSLCKACFWESEEKGGSYNGMCCRRN